MLRLSAPTPAHAPRSESFGALRDGERGQASRDGESGQALRDSESGQAIVEAALILPAMVFLILCALQLTLLQQARIMVEYAAFNAARTGIVHNANNGNNGTTGPMHDAAAFSVLPTEGQTDDFTHLATAWANFQTKQNTLRAAGLPLVQVAVLNPRKADFAKFGSHLNGLEIDFDDMRPDAARATLLSLQVRYLYELKVPFANKVVQSIWFASQLGILATWAGYDMSGPRIGNTQGADAINTTDNLALGRGSIPDGMPGGLSISALAGLARANKFYLPVNAWYTMRMQSNPYLQWAAP